MVRATLLSRFLDFFSSRWKVFKAAPAAAKRCLAASLRASGALLPPSPGVNISEPPNSDMEIWYRDAGATSRQAGRTCLLLESERPRSRRHQPQTRSPKMKGRGFDAPPKAT